MQVTGGLNYRPLPLFESARSLSLTKDGETDILTVHVHLAAMDAIWMAGRSGSTEVHEQLLDLVDAVQEVRENPRVPRYFTHMALANRFLEKPLQIRATERLLREVETFSAVKTIATRG